MKDNVFNYQLADDTIVFTDSLKNNSPYIAENPRDHESIFFVTKGTLLYEKEGTKELIKKGQIGYIKRGSKDISSAYLCDEVSYIAVNFSFDRGPDLHKNTLSFNTLCSTGNTYEYEKLFKDALNYFHSKCPGFMLLCNSTVIHIIGLLYNEHKTDIVTLRKIKQIEDAVQYLNKHYSSSDFKIKHLANVANMSEKHFRRIFYDIYNESPYTYLQKLRISKAEILLLNTSKKISDVALQCGFCDVYSFSHCFKKNTGMSPTQYKLSRT